MAERRTVAISIFILLLSGRASSAAENDGVAVENQGADLRGVVGNEAVWRWSCVNSKCIKTELTPEHAKTALSLEACKMFCTSEGTLWPKPTGVTSLGTKLIRINLQNISVVNKNHGTSDALVEAAVKRFKEKLPMAAPAGVRPLALGKALTVFLVNRNPNTIGLTLSTDEGYSLYTGAMANGNMNATIAADNFFGLRHGLETLLQLVIYDDLRNEIQMVKNAQITDNPVYPYRGILLDTSRNYYDMESIKKTIDAMASVKLNTFHWHITDTHSFPFVSRSRPELSKYGALSPSKVYTMSAIAELVEYALARGVRLLPEFDAPAHVGEGWQHTNMTVCFKAEPWITYCVEPPCGQLNPAHPDLYNVLQDIYNDMFEAFKPDLFHMGGDEVKDTCWNSSTQIKEFMAQNRWETDDQGFLKLWDYFQANAVQRVYKANNNEKLPVILWTSSLTDYNVIESYIPKEDYIIQVWTTGSDKQIAGLLKKGYKLIMSNYDALYLDCGFGAWIGTGNNWCSPYTGWQKVYDNSPAKIAGDDYKNLMLGGEAALWSEQSDASSLDNKLWPRSAALAERLWTEPDTDWSAAEQRLLHIRERLVRFGVQADSIQPEWCFQNEGSCYEV